MAAVALSGAARTSICSMHGRQVWRLSCIPMVRTENKWLGCWWLPSALTGIQGILVPVLVLMLHVRPKISMLKPWKTQVEWMDQAGPRSAIT